MLATIGVVLATIGAGDWSLDNAIGIDLNGPAGFLIAVVGGVGLRRCLRLPPAVARCRGGHHVLALPPRRAVAFPGPGAG